MGIVWSAYDEYLHRDVAIKEIAPRGREIRDTDPEVARALREARAAAKLSQHPGIITIHDVVTDNGLPWIVMEMLHGRSLHAALEADGPMRVDQAARVGVQVLQALDYAHTGGVLHRDVKPGNVMLVGDNGDNGVDKVVLTDFGIALIDGASVLTATGQLPGAPEYVAPERIRGDEASPAADLWSVGVMLYGMVVGRTPFHRGDVQATMGAVLSVHPDPNPKIGRLAPVIDGLLNKRPAERLTARRAIEQLAGIAALPAAAPPGLRVRVEYPTKAERPASDTTLADGTVPNTRLAPPAFAPQPPPAPKVAPEDPTLDPAPPPRPHLPPPPRRRAPWIVAGAAVIAAAVAVSVVLANTSPGDDDAAAPTTTQSTTTNAKAPLKTYSERLGFELAVPPDWDRSSSVEGPLSDVTWEGEQPDPTVGPLKVQVRRDTTKAGTSAIGYVTDEDRNRSADRDNVAYHRITRSGDGSVADLAYTYRAANGSTYFRFQTRAVAADNGMYTLTFSLYASDAGRLAQRWAAVEPLIGQIQDTFRLT